MKKKNNHKHISMEQAVELALLSPEKLKHGVDEEVLSCDYCRAQIEKKRQFHVNISNSCLQKSKYIYDDISAEVESANGILNYINANASADNNQHKVAAFKPEKRKSFASSYQLKFAAGILVLLSFALFFNYFHYLILTKDRFLDISSNKTIEVQRQGFLFGRQKLTTNKILLNFDKAEIDQDLVINTERGLYLYAKKSGYIRFLDNETAFKVNLISGTYFFDYNWPLTKERTIGLSSKSYINITGTILYVKSADKNYMIYMKEGDADLYLGNRSFKLHENMVYKLDDSTIFFKGKLSSREEYELLNPFITMVPGLADELNKDRNSRKAVKYKKIKHKKRYTLSEIQKRYGKILRISTKDGKEYIGAYIVGGANLSIITVNGVINIKSDDIEIVSGYHD